ncbi:MAG: porin, partial [Nitrospirota bacterium]
MKVFRLLMGLACLSLVLQTSAWATDELIDVLREKDVLTKEDWIRIEAAQEKKAVEQQKTLDAQFPVEVGWGQKGFELKTKDGNWATQIQWRFQSRWSYPTDSDPISAADFNEGPQSTFQLRRVRMKVGGHGYQPWIKYYFEMNWQSTSNSGSSAVSPQLLDWRISLEKFKLLSLQIGQWKV